MSYTTLLGFTPQYQITKSGDDITGSFSDRLLSIRFSSYYGGGDADTIDIDLDDRDWLIGLPSVGGSGTTLDVAMGYAETTLYSCGYFNMEEVNLSFPPKTMSLRGNSVSLNSNLKAPLQTQYIGKTVGEILGSVATAAGVTLSIDPAFQDIPIDVHYQFTSSGSMLSYFEKTFNGVAKFENGYLSFTQRGTGLTASGLNFGTVTLDPTDIAEFKIRLTNTSAFSKVRVSWWDPVNHKAVWVVSTVQGDSASTVPYQINHCFNTAVEAQAAADAQMKVLNRQGVTGSLTLSKGDASIRGGSKLTVIGTRDGMDGTYTVSEAVHTFTKDGGITSVLQLNTEDGVGAVDTGS